MKGGGSGRCGNSRGGGGGACCQTYLCTGKYLGFIRVNRLFDVIQLKMLITEKIKIYFCFSIVWL